MWMSAPCYGCERNEHWLYKHFPNNKSGTILARWVFALQSAICFKVHLAQRKDHGVANNMSSSCRRLGLSLCSFEHGNPVLHGESSPVIYSWGGNPALSLLWFFEACTQSLSLGQLGSTTWGDSSTSNVNPASVTMRSLSPTQKKKLQCTWSSDTEQRCLHRAELWFDRCFKALKSLNQLSNDVSLNKMHNSRTSI